jgi:hypothetical protein
MRQRFEYDFSKAKIICPDLQFEYVENGNFGYKVYGCFDVVDGENTCWGSFNASLYFKRNYPRGFAILVDESKAFPWDMSWHISKEGLCCVCSPLHTIEMETSDVSILQYITNYVIRFYANQVYKREYGHYKNGEYGHFDVGIWESLEDELNISDRGKILDILKYIESNPRRNKFCYCGSGKKIKSCHEHRIPFIKLLTRKHKLIGRTNAEKSV